MIRIDKYTHKERGTDPQKEYYIDQDGTRLSLTKVELEKMVCDLNLLGKAIKLKWKMSWFNAYGEVDQFIFDELDKIGKEFPIVDKAKPELNTIEAIKILINSV